MKINYKRSVELSLAELGHKMGENRDLPRNDVLRLMMIVEFQIAAYEELSSYIPGAPTSGFYEELHKILSMVL